MTESVCGIPKSILAEKQISDDEIIKIKESYNIYQRLLAQKLASTSVKCECGAVRSAGDRYRCRRTKKHALLVAANESMMNARQVYKVDEVC